MEGFNSTLFSVMFNVFRRFKLRNVFQKRYRDIEINRKYSKLLISHIRAMISKSFCFTPVTTAVFFGLRREKAARLFPAEDRLKAQVDPTACQIRNVFVFTSNRPEFFSESIFNVL